MSRKSSKNSGESQDSDVDMPHVDENLPFDPSSFLDQKRDCPHVSAIRVARLKRILPAALKSKSRRGCETCNKLRLTLTKPKPSDSGPPYRAISPPPSPPATPPPQLSLTDIPDPPQTLWLCLTCANLNCGRADLGHGLSHFELSRGIASASQPASASEDDSGAERAPGHPLVMNIETGQSWCYECDAEILAGPEVNVVITECYAMVRADVKSAGGLDVLFNRVPALTTSPAPTTFLPKRDDVLAPGLRNLGNTCFFNSILQNLSYTRPLIQRLAPLFPKIPLTGLDDLPSSATEAPDASELHAGPLSSALAEFLLTVYSRAATGTLFPPATPTPLPATSLLGSGFSATFLKPPVPFGGPATRSRGTGAIHTGPAVLGAPALDPSPVFKELCAKWPLYRTMRQQDAHEVLRRLVDGVGEEQEKAETRGAEGKDGGADGEKGQEKDTGNQKKKRTLVDEVFGGDLVSVVVCEVCKNVSLSHEPILDLLLPIPISPSPSPPVPSFVAEFLASQSSGLPPDPSYPLASDVDHLRHVDRLLRPGLAEDTLRTPVLPSAGAAEGDELTLVGCLEKFLAVEKLDGSDSLNCENCQRIHHPAFFNAEDGTLLPGAGKPPAMYRPAYKRLILLQDLPPVLVVGLKRFQTGYGGRTRKVQEWIRVPQVLEVKGVTASKSELGMGDNPSGGERGRARRMGAAGKRAGREESGGSMESGQPARKKSRSLSKEPTQLGTGLRTRLTASPEPTTGVVTRSRSSAAKGSSMSPSRPGHMHRPNTPRPLSPSLRPPTPAEPEPDTTFQLRGVVVHSGYQLASGHYYAYVRVPVVNKNSVGSGEGGDDMDIDGVRASQQAAGGGGAGEEDVWVYASDTDVRVTTWDEVKGAQAFMLFFERV